MLLKCKINQARRNSCILRSILERILEFGLCLLNHSCFIDIYLRVTVSQGGDTEWWGVTLSDGKRQGAMLNGSK